MRFIDKTAVRRYQQGGPVGDPAMASAPAEAVPQGGQDQMIAQLEQMAMSIIQEIGPEASMALAEMIMAILQQQASMGAPAEGAQPVFKKGGRIAGYRRK